MPHHQLRTLEESIPDPKRRDYTPFPPDIKYSAESDQSAVHPRSALSNPYCRVTAPGGFQTRELNGRALGVNAGTEVIIFGHEGGYHRKTRQRPPQTNTRFRGRL